MDLATAQSHLTDSLTQLDAARKAAAYGVGDQSKTAQGLADLQAQVDRWQREVNRLNAIASGVRTTMASVPSFR
jgi:phage shock protein A